MTHRELLEAENDRLVENLGSKVSALHSVSPPSSSHPLLATVMLLNTHIMCLYLFCKVL